jgi:intracellular proteinase inhibitor BsuPI
MNTRLAISLLIAGALAFACGPRSHSEAPAALASAIPVNTSAPPVPEKITRRTAAKASAAKVEHSFDVQVSQRAVRFVLDVTNAGAKHVELDFVSGQAYDFVVVDSVGREVWRWSADRLFTQGVQNKQLSRGESMQARETWTRPAPGRYTAIATLRSANFPVEERADFVVH